MSACTCCTCASHPLAPRSIWAVSFLIVKIIFLLYEFVYVTSCNLHEMNLVDGTGLTSADAAVHSHFLGKYPASCVENLE